MIHAWAEGAGLDDIGQAATFDLLTGRFEVPDNNPADVIASEWQWLSLCQLEVAGQRAGVIGLPGARAGRGRLSVV
ncbi:hypothetical protein ACN6AT_34645 [Streptomyces sp. JL4002]|uniref:hypothetical protein n=1 Tax=Streptomyces sp. JL4002 TaxID=3404781 RepID=UPI003B27D17B